VIRKARLLLAMVKFEHTLFALPFALISALVAAGGLPAGRTLGWMLVAMVGARTSAMAFNRLADEHLDRLNPRTQDRALPRGLVSRREAWLVTLVGAAALVVAAGMLNRLALALSPVALALVWGYSYSKRFSVLSHLLLGLCLGIAPVGAWIAVTGRVELTPLVLAAAVMLWTAGFDLIYACQDYDFDRQVGLHSLPARLGMGPALLVSLLLHGVMVGLLAWYGWLVEMLGWYWLGLAAASVILAYEHTLVSPRDLSRVNQAFFTVNGVVSVGLMVATAADLLVR